MQRHAIAICLLVGVITGCSRQEAPSAQTPIPVSTGKPRQVQARTVIPLSGSVVSPDNPSNVAFLSAGKVLRVIPREGDFVRKGQVLAVVDPADYRIGVDAAVAQVAQAHAVMEKAESPARPEVVEQARVAFERAQDEYRRMKMLYEAKSLAPNDFRKFSAAYEVARQQYNQAQAGGQKEDRAQARAAWQQAQAAERVARKHLADATLLAPMDGYIAARLVEVGDVVGSGRPGFQMVTMDPVEIQSGIPETDIRLVRKGQSATVQVSALPGEQFLGVVRVINVAADPATRTYMVRIAVPNPRHLLRLGMIAQAQIQGDDEVPVTTLPGSAIVRDPQGAATVFVYFPDQGRVFAKRVEVGSVRGTDVEIKSGLAGNESVVLAGQNKLREGSPVTVVAPGGDAK